MARMKGPTGWFPDPFGRFQLRYWDGGRWTEHVASHGRQMVDQPVGTPIAASTPTVMKAIEQTMAVAPPASAPVAASPRDRKKVQKQLRQTGVVAGARAGEGSLLSEPVLVVNQQPKLIDANAEFRIYDQYGDPVGSVREIGQSRLKNAMSLRSGPHRLQVFERSGQMLMTLSSSRTRGKTTLAVRQPDGIAIGEIVQQTMGFLGKVRFDLMAGGRRVGSLNAEGWQTWDFSIQDTAGNEVAHISKEAWTGWASFALTSSQKRKKERSSKARRRDKYVVEIHRPLEDPLRSLVVGAALAVDTALRQG